MLSTRLTHLSYTDISHPKKAHCHGAEIFECRFAQVHYEYTLTQDTYIIHHLNPFCAGNGTRCRAEEPCHGGDTASWRHMWCCSIYLKGSTLTLRLGSVATFSGGVKCTRSMPWPPTPT